MRNVLIVVFVAWMVLFNGYSTIKNIISNYNITGVPQTIITGANRVASGSQVKPLNIPPVVSPPTNRIELPVSVEPQGVPILPTVTPTPEVAGGLTDTQKEEMAKLHQLIASTPTPVQYGTPECNTNNATYHAKKIVEKNGIPIGEVTAISCVSQDEADNGVNLREIIMLQQAGE